MARVSVPLWGVALSRPLPVIALVGHYPTNKLIGTRPLHYRGVNLFPREGSCDITPSFDELCHDKGYVPCVYSPVRHCLNLATLTVRLACLRHAASVHPEPGSNSQKELTRNILLRINIKFLPPFDCQGAKMRTKKPDQLVGMVVPKSNMVLPG